MNVTSASIVPPYMIDHHQPAHHESPKAKSLHYMPMVGSYLIDEECLSTWRASHRLPPSTPPILLHHGLHVCTIMAPNPSSNSHHLGLQVGIIMASKLYPKTCPIMASNWISEFSQSQPPGASPN